MATATATDKRIAKIKVWLKNQPPEVQTRLGDMLDKGLVKDVEAELPAGWASKQKPIAQTVPKADPEVYQEVDPNREEFAAKKTKAIASDSKQTFAPKAEGGKIANGGTKLQSVANNPSAKATKDAVTAELGAAGKTGTAAAEGAAEGTAKGLGAAAAKTKGLGKALTKFAGPAYVGLNLYGRGKEFYDDISSGKTIGEAVNKPESNKALRDNLIDAAAVAAGERIGATVGSRFGMELPGALVGGAAAVPVSRFATRTYDVAVNGPKDYTKPKQITAPTAPKKVSSISIDEAANWLQQHGIQEPTTQDYQRAFEQLDMMQQEQINKTPETKPSTDTYKPSQKEALAMMDQAVKAPIGIQNKTQEPDIMSYLNQPDTQSMLAELSAKQANRVQSAGSMPDLKPLKKKKDGEEDEEGVDSSSSSVSTSTANVRPPPRFFVNTGRFGTMAGGGSRRSPSGRLL